MRLYEARLDLDRSCNYRCKYCPNFHESDHKNSSLCLENLDNAFRTLNQLCWNIWLSCAGEPLLHPFFNKIIQCANEKVTTADMAIVTNGYLLDQDKIQTLIQSRISRIYISIDTIDPKLYSYYCNTSQKAFERVKKNVEELIFQRNGLNSPKIFIVAIVMKSNIDKMMELLKWVNKTGINGIRLHWLTADNDNPLKNEVIGINEAKEVFKKMMIYKRKYDLSLEYPYEKNFDKLNSIIRGIKNIRNKKEYLYFYLRKYLASKSKNRCRMAGCNLDINTNGDLFICPARKYKLGNIFNDDSNKLLKSINDEIVKLNEKPYEECVQCLFKMS